jgi:lysophospholipase L1-like esterase
MSRRSVSCRVVFAVVLLAGTVAVAGPPSVPAPAAAAVATSVVPTTTAERLALPSSIAVLGDSISAATGTGGLLPGTEQPANSWSTGTSGSVLSTYRRLLAINPAINGKNYRMATNGRRMTHMAEQALAMPTDTAYVQVQLGGNDVCKSSEAELTPVETYRTQFVAGLAAIAQRAPDALVFVASVPDIYNLWFLRGAPNPPNPIPSSSRSTAYLLWDTLGVIPCQSMVANPDSLSEADEARRQRVRERNKAYNEVLAEECAKVLRCRFDDFATFDFSSNRATAPDGPLLPHPEWAFVDADISTQDHFHPSISGQNKLSEVAWTASYDFSDQTVPVRGVVDVDPGPSVTGVHPVGAPVTVHVPYSDAAGMRGVEYRVHRPDVSVGAWTPVLASSLTVEITPEIGSTFVETRGFDLNGNRSASQLVEVRGARVPDAPTNLTFTAATTVGTGVVTWTSPSGQGDPVSDFVVSVARTSTGAFATFADGPGIGPSATVTGLVPGVRYSVRVASSNSLGVGPWSDVATLLLRPAAPSGVVGTPGDRSISVQWDPPTDPNVEIAAFTVRARSATPGEAPTVVLTCTASPCVVGGLLNGVSYRVGAGATNDAGASVLNDSSALVRPRTVPGAPTAVVATPGPGAIDLTWSPPTVTGGEQVTGYRVELGSDEAVCTTPAAQRTCTITGLVNGVSATVSVRALNVAGAGEPASVTATPADVPGAPRDVIVRPGDGRLTVSWSVPLSDGGSSITGYTATAMPGGATCSTTSATTCTITPLSNGAAYSVTVRAVNAVGAGPGADPVTEAALRIPGVPTIGSASVGDRSITVRFGPAEGYGMPITGYSWSVSTDRGRTWSPWAPVAGGASARTLTLTGRSNGVGHLVRLRASSAAGQGLAVTTASLTPRTTPAAPRITKVAPARRAVVVSFRSGADGGAAVTNHQVSLSANGGRTWSAFRTLRPVDAASPVRVAGLRSGTTYRVRLRAVNAAGVGAVSAMSAPVTTR